MFDPVDKEYRALYKAAEHKMAKEVEVILKTTAAGEQVEACRLSLRAFNATNMRQFAAYTRRLVQVLPDYMKRERIAGQTATYAFGQAKKIVGYKIKEAYWTQLVQITRRDIDALKNRVNAFLEADNGTAFLKMAYEEVLFPSWLTGKKKYFGFQHLEEENFHPADKDIFIKGIDIVKQGQSMLAKTVGMDIIRTSCSVENELDPLDLVKQAIGKVYSTKWDHQYFKLTGRYKALKKDADGNFKPGNIPIQTFVRRMVATHDQYTKAGDHLTAAIYTPPDLGDKFEYVVVKKGRNYNLRGNKIELKKGDKMEYFHAFVRSQATNAPMEIDLNYYMEGAIIGLFARFISYREDFAAPSDYTPDEADKYSVNEASKWITKYCENITGFDRKAVLRQGVDYRALSKNVDKLAMRSMIERQGSKAFLIHALDLPDNFEDTLHMDPTAREYEKQVKHVFESMKSEAMEIGSKREDFGEEFLNNVLAERGGRFAINLFTLKNYYCVRTPSRPIPYWKMQIEMYAEKIRIAEKKLEELVPRLLDVNRKYAQCRGNLINELREKYVVGSGGIPITDEVEQKTSQLNNFGEEEQAVLDEVHSIFVDLVVAYHGQRNVADIKLAIEQEISRRTGASVVAPSAADLKNVKFAIVDLPDF